MFKNRNEAGALLAEKLLPYKPQHPLILALPRGGVPVGFEVAKALEAPLDTLVVRKIGAPFNPEFGVGAIAPGGITIIDTKTLGATGLTREDLDPIIEDETKELERRISVYHSGEYSKEADARTVILVDDGLATGVTARAAVESAFLTQGPFKIIFASPVCAKDTANSLRNAVDTVCVMEVNDFKAVGYWYEHFPQTSDKEVIACLEKANAREKEKSYAFK